MRQGHENDGISRRGFLKRAGLLGAALCVNPVLEKATAEEMTEIENAVAAIPVVGSRYDALQESKIQK